MTRPRWTTTSAIAAAVLVVLAVTAFLVKGGEPVGASMSAMKRTILAQSPTQYWPLEDGSDTQRTASALPGGTSLQVVGTVAFGADGPAGSGSLPDFNDGSLFGTFAGSDNDSWTVEFALKLDSPTGTGNTTILSWTTDGDPGVWRVSAADSPFNDVWVYYVSRSGTEVLVATFNEGDTIDLFDGEWHHYQITRWTVPSITSAAILTTFLDGVYATNWGLTTGLTATGGTVGRINGAFVVAPERSGDLTNLGFGHLAMWSPALDYPGDPDTTASATYAAVNGYAGETAAVRFARLCTEAGVAYDVAS